MKTELELALNVSQRTSGTGWKTHVDKGIAGLERLGDISSPGLATELSVAARTPGRCGLEGDSTRRLGPGRPEMGCT